jgi:hypothetical protein
VALFDLFDLCFLQSSVELSHVVTVHVEVFDLLLVLEVPVHHITPAAHVGLGLSVVTVLCHLTCLLGGVDA